jgi:hypothetical protein
VIEPGARDLRDTVYQPLHVDRPLEDVVGEADPGELGRPEGVSEQKDLEPAPHRQLPHASNLLERPGLVDVHDDHPRLLALDAGLEERERHVEDREAPQTEDDREVLGLHRGVREDDRVAARGLVGARGVGRRGGHEGRQSTPSPRGSLITRRLVHDAPRSRS